VRRGLSGGLWGASVVGTGRCGGGSSVPVHPAEKTILNTRVV
jgi:hypothetical protein